MKMIIITMKKMMMEIIFLTIIIMTMMIAMSKMMISMMMIMTKMIIIMILMAKMMILMTIIILIIHIHLMKSQPLHNLLDEDSMPHEFDQVDRHYGIVAKESSCSSRSKLNPL